MILQADSHDPEGRFASSRRQSHEPGTRQLIDLADIPVTSSKERDRWARSCGIRALCLPRSVRSHRAGGFGTAAAGDVWLTVPDIVSTLRLGRNRLVALPACESGIVDVRHLPDEFVGLPAAFLTAGAPGVLATFWSVLDSPTATLVRRIYHLHLRKGKAPAAALCQAVLELRSLGAAAAAAPRQALPGDNNDEITEGPAPRAPHAGCGRPDAGRSNAVRHAPDLGCIRLPRHVKVSRRKRLACHV
jgi:CHAT domain